MAKKKRKRKKKRAKKRSTSDFSSPLFYSASDTTSNNPELYLASTSDNLPGITVMDSSGTRKNRKLNIALKLVGLISDGLLSKIAALVLHVLVEKVFVTKKHSYLKKLESFLIKLNKDIAENRTKRFLS